MILYTAGYGNRRVEWFFAELQRLLPVNCYIIDVRRSAAGWSPEFSAKRLKARFGARYFHRPALGNVSGCAERWESPTPEWVERDLHALARTLDGGAHVCLLCAEKKPENCHRQHVAAALAERVDSLEIVHLLAE